MNCNAFKKTKAAPGGLLLKRVRPERLVLLELFNALGTVVTKTQEI